MTEQTIMQITYSTDKVELAEAYARKYHVGQFRKDKKTPYVEHPKEVASLVENYGFKDVESRCIALLHDTLEDTTLSYDEIEQRFGKTIADGVYILTRNVDEDEYKRRLLKADKNVQAVKICDTLHNISTLEYLRPGGIYRKIYDCMTCYLKLADDINRKMSSDMNDLLMKYFARNSLQN